MAICREQKCKADLDPTGRSVSEQTCSPCFGRGRSHVRRAGCAALGMLITIVCVLLNLLIFLSKGLQRTQFLLAYPDLGVQMFPLASLPNPRQHATRTPSKWFSAITASFFLKAKLKAKRARYEGPGDPAEFATGAAGGGRSSHPHRPAAGAMTNFDPNPCPLSPRCSLVEGVAGSSGGACFFCWRGAGVREL